MTTYLKANIVLSYTSKNIGQLQNNKCLRSPVSFIRNLGLYNVMHRKPVTRFKSVNTGKTSLICTRVKKKYVLST